MTRTAKWVLVGSALVGLVLGVVAGIGDARLSGELTETVQMANVQLVPADFAMRQFQYADSDHARGAVQFEMRMLEQLARAEPTKAADINGSLGLAYARLAMIEEADARTVQAKAAFDQARTLLKKSHPREEMTDEVLRRTIRKRDAIFEKLGM